MELVLQNVELAQESIQELNLWKNRMEVHALERMKRLYSVTLKNALVGSFLRKECVSINVLDVYNTTNVF